MARGRKAQSAAVRFGTVLAALLFCGAFSGAGLGYVWHRNRNEQLRRQIEQLQARREELRMQNQNLERQLEDARSYRSLEQRVKELNLGLVMPQPAQILRLPERWVQGGARAGAATVTASAGLP